MWWLLQSLLINLLFISFVTHKKHKLILDLGYVTANTCLVHLGEPTCKSVCAGTFPSFFRYWVLWLKRARQINIQLNRTTWLVMGTHAHKSHLASNSVKHSFSGGLLIVRSRKSNLGKFHSAVRSFSHWSIYICGTSHLAIGTSTGNRVRSWDA